MDNQNKYYEKQLNFRDLFLLIMKKLKKILLIGFCISLMVVAYKFITARDILLHITKSTFEQRDDFIGQAKIFLGPNMDTVTSEAVRSFLKGNDVLQNVITNLNNDIDFDTLSSMISLENSTDTIVLITIVGSDESLVQSITSNLSTIGSSKIIATFNNNNVIVLEPAYTKPYNHKVEIPVVVTSYYNLIKKLAEYAVIGFALGVFIVIGFYYLLYMVDDKMR